MFVGRVFLSTDSRHFIWVSTVLLFSPTCPFISPRQTSYRGFRRNTKRSYPYPYRFSIYMIFFH